MVYLQKQSVMYYVAASQRACAGIVLLLRSRTEMAYDPSRVPS